MTVTQRNAITEVIRAISSLAYECERDQDFNDKVAKAIADNEITKYSLDDMYMLIADIVDKFENLGEQ